MLYESGYFKKGYGKLLDDAFDACLKRLRPQMVSMVEHFDVLTDKIPSTIGNAYGDIYEMQFETAKASSMNSAIVPSIFETHMKPVMNIRRPVVPKL